MDLSNHCFFLPKTYWIYTKNKSFTPSSKIDRFLEGVDFFSEDPLGSSDHPKIIVRCLKVVWALPKNFVGPPAGFRRLTSVQKVFHCPKTSKNQHFLTKIGWEYREVIFTCSFSSQNLHYNVLWPRKILRDVPAPSGCIWAPQKRTILLKIAKITKKCLIFTSKNLFFKCAQTIWFLLFFILKQLKNKIKC